MIRQKFKWVCKKGQTFEILCIFFSLLKLLWGMTDCGASESTQCARLLQNWLLSGPLKHHSQLDTLLALQTSMLNILEIRRLASVEIRNADSDIEDEKSDCSDWVLRPLCRKWRNVRELTLRLCPLTVIVPAP